MYSYPYSTDIFISVEIKRRMILMNPIDKLRPQQSSSQFAPHQSLSTIYFLNNMYSA